MPRGSKRKAVSHRGDSRVGRPEPERAAPLGDTVPQHPAGEISAARPLPATGRGLTETAVREAWLRAEACCECVKAA